MWARFRARYASWGRLKKMGFWIGAVFAALMVIGSIGNALGMAKPETKTAARSTTTVKRTTTTRPRPITTTTSPPGPEATTAPTFLGQRKGDKFAGSDYILTIGDWVLAATNLSATDPGKGLCSQITIGYGGRQSTAHYSASDWSLEDAYGAITRPNIFSDADGEVARGGRALGSVCFGAEPGSGQFELFFTGSSAGRGVWRLSYCDDNGCGADRS